MRLPEIVSSLTDSHINDQRVFERSKSRPIEVRITFALRMAGDESDGLRMIAMREGHPRRGGATGRRRNAGRDESLNPGGAHGVKLFAAAPEHKRIAALEAHDRFAFARKRDHCRFDLRLRNGMVSLRFTHINPFRVPARERQNRIADKPVVENDIRALEKARSF